MAEENMAKEKAKKQRKPRRNYERQLSALRAYVTIKLQVMREEEDAFKTETADRTDGRIHELEIIARMVAE